MTCAVGQFAIPGFDALSEALVVHEQGGAIAVWAPAGLSDNSEAKILNQGFFSAFFDEEDTRLGDVVLEAFEAFDSQGGDAYIIDIYNLLGDPALRVW